MKLCAVLVVIVLVGSVAANQGDHERRISMLKNDILKKGGVVSDALSFELCDEEEFIGGRCVFAARDIKKGEVLLELPWTVGVSPKMAWDNLPERIRQIQGLEFESNAVIAFYLIQERERLRTGGESSIASWLATLPDYKGLPIYYHEDDLDVVPEGSVGPYNDLIQKVDVSYQRYCESSHNNATILLDREVYNLEKWKWAITTVVDRHLPLSMNGTFFSVLMPLVDLFNTHYNNTLGMKTTAGDEGLSLFANQDHAKGEQLYTNVALDANNELFARGGFALENNPASRINLILPDISEDPLHSMRYHVLKAYGFDTKQLNGRMSVPLYLSDTPPVTKAVLRVLEATPDEFSLPLGNFSEPVTLRNELAMARALVNIGGRLESANNSRLSVEDEMRAYQEETNKRQKYARIISLESRIIGRRTVMDAQVEWNQLLFREEFANSGSRLPCSSLFVDPRGAPNEQSSAEMVANMQGAAAEVPGQEDSLEITDGDEGHWMEREEL